MFLHHSIYWPASTMSLRRRHILIEFFHSQLTDGAHQNFGMMLKTRMTEVCQIKITIISVVVKDN